MLRCRLFRGIREHGSSSPCRHPHVAAESASARSGTSTRATTGAAGLRSAVTAGVVVEALATQHLDVVLNVRHRNLAARRIYERLGFVTRSDFVEGLARRFERTWWAGRNAMMTCHDERCPPPALHYAAEGVVSPKGRCRLLRAGTPTDRSSAVAAARRVSRPGCRRAAARRGWRAAAERRSLRAHQVHRAGDGRTDRCSIYVRERTQAGTVLRSPSLHEPRRAVHPRRRHAGRSRVRRPGARLQLDGVPGARRLRRVLDGHHRLRPLDAAGGDERPVQPRAGRTGRVRCRRCCPRPARRAIRIS